MIIDTLKLKTKLELAGMDNQAAVAIADALGNADFDQLATKTDIKTEITAVRTEIADVKADLQTEIADVRTEIATVKADIQTDIAAVRTEIATVKADLYRALWIQWGATVAAVAAIATISKLF